MLPVFERTALLIGEEAIDKLNDTRVAVFGIGGVGGYVCEALVRSGIGSFDLIDHDRVCLSNINRQIIATHSTIGRYKAEVMRERMLDINPDATINVHNCFFLPENEGSFPFDEYDYVVDAVDTVTAKIELVMKCKSADIPIISSMGAGNKLEASSFEVADIYDTRMCPLARVMRTELKKRGVKKLKVVYSPEKPITPNSDTQQNERECQLLSRSAVAENGNKSAGNEATHENAIKSPIEVKRRSTPGSMAFVPSVAGLIIAGEVVKDLTGKKGSF